MRRIAALTVFASVVLAQNTPLDACTCVRSGPACQSAWEADAVFVARVIGFDPRADDTPTPDERGLLRIELLPSVRVRVQVLESFRGAPVGEATLLTGPGTCGYGFVTGETYLVYAGRDASGAWATSICSRTRRVDRAGDDLAYLRGIGRRPSVLGTIQGTVRQEAAAYADGKQQPEPRPVAGARVVARSAERAYDALTGADGTYTIAALPDTYEVSVDSPYGWWSPGPFGSTVLRDPRGCVSADLLMRPDGRISGRVVDATGTPIAGLLIEARRWESVSRGIGSSQATAVTGVDGTFELMRLSPQAYALAAAGLFHPGTVTDGDATRVALAVAQRTTVPDFVLPVPTATVQGVVRDEAGGLVHGATVSAVAREGGRVAGRFAPTGADGVFRMTVPAGAAYYFVTQVIEGSGVRVKWSEPFDVPTSVSGLQLLLPERSR